MQKNISVEILKSSQLITSLNSITTIIDQKTFTFDQLAFPFGEELFHQNTGYLGYRENFIIHAQTEIHVLQEGYYTFIIESDDGFMLKLNNQVLCEYIDARIMESTLCKIYLNKGKQLFALKYFQGFGHLGLQIYYQKDTKPAYLIGKDSEYFKFAPIGPN